MTSAAAATTEAISIPNPSPELIEALNACRKRTGPCGVSFEPEGKSLKYEGLIREQLGDMGIRSVVRFYNLSNPIVKHFENFGLDTSNAMNVGEVKGR